MMSFMRPVINPRPEESILKALPSSLRVTRARQPRQKHNFVPRLIIVLSSEPIHSTEVLCEMLR